ncbi:hypothetical protein, partial [Corallococcus sp. AB018]|uniref:hypothetical protein n=1 Tax=Corallococcus sp. AB018 TaxID=2316715 RepID=UPI001F1AF490
ITVKATFRYGETDAGEKMRKLKDMANKLTDLQTVVNLMMQNNVMQPTSLLQDMPAPATKTSAQKTRSRPR